jgi:hypothetical protein
MTPDNMLRPGLPIISSDCRRDYLEATLENRSVAVPKRAKT